ncbi:MAG: GGDEF domain-containing protein, partial [Nitriliruptoraceae bacterium]
MRRVPPPDLLDRRRTMLLGLALLAPPVVMLWTSVREIATSPVTLAAAWGALVPAVLARLLLLARARDVARDAALAGQRRTTSLVSHTSDALLLVDAEAGRAGEGRRWAVTYASPATDTVLGVTPEALEHRSVLDVVVDEDHGVLQELLEDVGSLPRARDVRVAHRDGSTRWVSVVVDEMADHEAERIVTLRDVTDGKRAELRWAEQAHTDPLTGTLNRRGIEDCIESALVENAEEGTLLGVMLGDLDGFKEINDRFGHTAGDDVLREVADRLRSSVREVDIVGRFGGDEFVIVCAGLESRDDLERVAERIPSTVGAPMQVAGMVEPVSVGICVGVAIAEPGVDSISRLL